MTEPTLASLRAAGAHRVDPLRFHYLEVLAGRLASQPEPVRQVLTRKLHQAVQQYDERARAASMRDIAVQEPAANSPLWQLNAELQTRVREASDSLLPEGSGGAAELQSARRFSEVWSKISTERQFKQILAQEPENAGPLNSHKLMLRSLALMHALSPDYLRHFLIRMEALRWLEQTQAKFPSAESRPGRRERRQR